MAATGRFGIYPAQFVGGSTLTLQQIHGVTVTPGSSKDVIVPGGAVDPSAIPNVMADPRVTLSTHDLVTLLGTVSVSAGFPVTTSFQLQYQAREDGATFTGAGANVKVSGTKAWFGISSFSCSQDDDNGAVAECQIWPLFDGTNDPLVISTAQNLTSTPAFTSKFYMGPVYVNSSAVTGIQSVRVDTGLEYRAVRQSGDVYARLGSIYVRKPQIEITTFNHAAGGTSAFNEALAGTIAVYFWKGSSGGSRAAVAGTVHCKLSAATGVWSPQQYSVQNIEDGTVTWVADITGTLASAVNSAIP